MSDLVNQDQSQSVKELATALSKAQSEIKNAEEDSSNTFFKGSKYASLTSVWKAIRPALAKNNLSITQTTVREGDGWSLKTILLHSSGEWISGVIPLLLNKQDMQQLGSAITYARRYGVSSMLGVVSDADDDGNRASQPESHFEQKNESKSYAPLYGKPTEKQLKRLFAISKSNNWSDDQVRNYMSKHYDKFATSELSIEDYNDLCAQIEKNPVNKSKPVEESRLDPEDKEFPWDQK